MYLHLNQNSVQPPQKGIHVNEGEWIADSDDTGSGSSGPHLHLQIVVNSLADRNIDTLDSANKSRNPEIWLNPYNIITGSVIGKVTNTNGDPVPGISVYGLGKDPSWGYSFNETYTTTATLPPDDILIENWATTDVTPGYYHITLNNGSDLGWHTVEAGQITYVDLYPVWLPNIYGYNSGWISYIMARNNNSQETAQVYLTYFKMDGSVHSQEHTNININTLHIFTPPEDFYGSASIVSNEDLSVAVETQNGSGSEQNSYTGITPKNGIGFLGWEEAGSLLYAPSIKRNYYGRSSTIYIFNSGVAPTTVHVDYYDQYGNPRSGGNYLVDSYSSATISPTGSGSGGCGADQTLCSAKISASPSLPLAVSVLEYNTSTGLETTSQNVFTSGADTIYFPAFKRNYYSMTSGLNIQNVGNAPTDISVFWYNSDGTQKNCNWIVSLQPNASAAIPDWSCLGDNFIGTAIAIAYSNHQPIVGAGYERSVSGQSRKKVYSAYLFGSRHVYAPIVYGDQPYIWSGVNVMCTSNNNCNVWVNYYNADGTLHNVESRVINAHGRDVFYPNPGMTGSAEITSDQDIAGLVNIITKWPTGDTMAIYNTVAR